MQRAPWREGGGQCLNKHPKGEVRLTQLVIAPFATETGSSYSTLGLGADGVVYRYDPKCEGGIPWSMTIAGCRDDHKGKR